MNFRDKIVKWYFENKRDLPWRNSSDAYEIWVSEMILQQTRVDQGLPYYHRFLEYFPNVKSLAEASEQEVLYVWKGLGYYSRARYMHSTAREIVAKANGVFPNNYSSLIKLKGIGSYTAAAVSSICNYEVKAAIDGNVTRVLSRYFGVTDTVGSSVLIKKIEWISNQLIPDAYPGDYNQAMMEYGALICTPKQPKCSECTVMTSCFAYNNKMTGIIPLKKKAAIKKTRYFNYLHLITESGKIILKKRTSNDIWKNLWDFPLIESDCLFEPETTHPEFEDLLKHTIDPVLTGFCDITHILTHQALKVRFFTFRISEESEIKAINHFELVPQNDISYPIPRLIENFLKRNDIFFGYD